MIVTILGIVFIYLFIVFIADPADLLALTGECECVCLLSMIYTVFCLLICLDCFNKVMSLQTELPFGD